MISVQNGKIFKKCPQNYYMYQTLCIFVFWQWKLCHYLSQNFCENKPLIAFWILFPPNFIANFLCFSPWVSCLVVDSTSSTSKLLTYGFRLIREAGRRVISFVVLSNTPTMYWLPYICNKDNFYQFI